MSKEEFNFSDKKISIEKREDVGSSYKINAYKTKLKLMQERKIPQKDINDLINHFFNKNTYIGKFLTVKFQDLVDTRSPSVIFTTTVEVPMRVVLAMNI